VLLYERYLRVYYTLKYLYVLIVSVCTFHGQLSHPGKVVTSNSVFNIHFIITLYRFIRTTVNACGMNWVRNIFHYSCYSIDSVDINEQDETVSVQTFTNEEADFIMRRRYMHAHCLERPSEVGLGGWCAASHTQNGRTEAPRWTGSNLRVYISE
jgi:hypothetical protein